VGINGFFFPHSENNPHQSLDSFLTRHILNDIESRSGVIGIERRKIGVGFSMAAVRGNC
jgi:hypothetical protein